MVYVYVYNATYTMKTKLTVTADREILPKAKRYARARGVSLSSLIEDALRGMAEPDRPSFANRWRGRFVPAEKDDERYRALAGKYL
jgi:post-segregation antitoxin (ccd killing protein)